MELIAIGIIRIKIDQFESFGKSRINKLGDLRFDEIRYDDENEGGVRMIHKFLPGKFELMRIFEKRNINIFLGNKIMFLVLDILY